MNYQGQIELEKLVARWKKRLGLPSIYRIKIHIAKKGSKLARGGSDSDAWINMDNQYPYADIVVQETYLKTNKKTPECIVRTIVHEMCHLVMELFFRELIPKRKHWKAKHRRVEEHFVFQLAQALVPIANEELYK